MGELEVYLVLVQIKGPACQSWQAGQSQAIYLLGLAEGAPPPEEEEQAASAGRVQKHLKNHGRFRHGDDYELLRR